MTSTPPSSHKANPQMAGVVPARTDPVITCDSELRAIARSAAANNSQKQAVQLLRGQADQPGRRHRQHPGWELRRFGITGVRLDRERPPGALRVL